MLHSQCVAEALFKKTSYISLFCLGQCGAVGLLLLLMCSKLRTFDHSSTQKSFQRMQLIFVLCCCLSHLLSSVAFPYSPLTLCYLHHLFCFLFFFQHPNCLRFCLPSSSCVLVFCCLELINKLHFFSDTEVKIRNEFVFLLSTSFKFQTVSHRTFIEKLPGVQLHSFCEERWHTAAITHSRKFFP